jgi:hypothetical protein
MRTYYLNGKRVPGVTTVIDSQSGWNKRALMMWAVREATAGNDPMQQKAKAADAGTVCHELIRSHFTEKPFDWTVYPADVVKAGKRAYAGFESWREQYSFTLVASELSLVSPELKCGGTLDLVVSQDDDTYLVDFKTSKGVYPEFIVQVAAYANIYEEVQGVPISLAYILHLDKESGEFTTYPIPRDTIDTAFTVFTHWRDLYQLQKELGI